MDDIGMRALFELLEAEVIGAVHYCTSLHAAIDAPSVCPSLSSSLPFFLCLSPCFLFHPVSSVDLLLHLSRTVQSVSLTP